MMPIFARTLRLCARNPGFLLPALLATVVMYGADLLLQGGGYTSWRFFRNLNVQGPGAYGLYVATIVAIGLRAAGFLLVGALTAGMARMAWDSGHARFWDGLAALGRALIPAVETFVLLLLLGGAAAALVVPTFALSLPLYAWMATFAMPAAVLERRSAGDALLLSMRRAAASAPFAAACALALIVLSAAGAAAAGVGGWTLTEFAGAFVTIAAVGEYASAREPEGTGPNA